MTFLDAFSDLLVDAPTRPLLRDRKGWRTVDEVYLTAKSVVQLNLGGVDFKGAPVAILQPPGLPYVSALLAVWMCGGLAVPLCPEHTPTEMQHQLADSGAQFVLCHPKLKTRLPKMRIRIEETENEAPPEDPLLPLNLAYPAPKAPALMLYTSGTTGAPKGVVHTHAALYAQITMLHTAWGWTADDAILHVLPLHHTHGIVNKLLCALLIGARCDMRPGFDAADVWPGLASGHYTLFMAVPTIYAKLIAAWDAADAEKQQKWSAGAAKLRLMVSGSAALPVPVLERWKAITGHTLLERYGMTETGMVLSNPLTGNRLPGYVGTPLPGVAVRLANEDGTLLETPDAQGELQVSSPALFRDYWKRPAETKAAFTRDGWFKTGDLAERIDGNYRIAGRIATDILKSGGYKISALEIEHVLLAHPAIAECAVLGLPDETWGERVAAVVVLRAGHSLDLDALREFAAVQLAPYKLPSHLQLVDALPRNAMGKVLKKEVANLMN